MNHDEPEQLMNPTQAAELLGVKEGTLAVWRSTGRYQIPYIKVGRKVKYWLSDLNNFLNERTYFHTGEQTNADP